jgi:hypothetical protein
MTKLEAWQAWCATAGTADLATEFTLEKSSHGKAFSFAWDAAAKAERKRILEMCKEGWWDGEGIRYHLEKQDAIRR